MTKTRLAVSVVSAITDNHGVVFNDKLKDGTRSLKVWGWSLREYSKCAELLREMGCTVKSRHQPVLRLHIKES